MDKVISVSRLGSPRDRLRRLNAEFLRPHHPAMILALVAMLLQSLLVLPLPLLQGWVLDRLLLLFDPARGTPLGHGLETGPNTTALAWLVGLALGASVLCHLGRM